MNEDRSGIDHLRLAGDRVLIVTDKDELAWKERRRDLMRSFGKEVAVADAREVENLLAPEVIQKVLVKYEKVLEVRWRRPNRSESPSLRFERIAETSSIQG